LNMFALRLALREGRASLRRVGLYGLSISLGVAAMVSVQSFRDDVSRSVRAQARELMGADGRFESNRAFDAVLAPMIDSLTLAGARTAALTSTGSMVGAKRSGTVRLLQLRGVEGGWPMYGAVSTEPAGAWARLSDADVAVVDRAVLTQLDVAIGDTLRIGSRLVQIAGVADELPGSLGFQSALGPRVWLGQAALEATQLLGFGSLVEYERFVAVDDPEELEVLPDRYDDLLARERIDFDTAAEQANQITRGIGFLGDFLGLVGLGALLLGGLGVASAVHVFVRERLAQVAVLRCIGAQQGEVFSAYLLQAAALGLVGASLGAVLGLGVQQVLPTLFAGVLPVDVQPQIWWSTLAIGVGSGVWISSLFALFPLLAIRDVPPLRAIRTSTEVARASDWRARAWVGGLLVGSVTLLAMSQAPNVETGVGFTLGLLVAAAILAGLGLLIVRVTRRLVPAKAAYTIRQGVSNLFRPANQTVSVTLVLGLGAFIVASVIQVRSNLVRELRFEGTEGQSDALLFDIQSDQVDGVLGLLPEGGAIDVTPIVQARLAALDGVGVEELADRPSGDRPQGWTLRREYRHTWRAELTDAETLLEGAWWAEAPQAEPGVARVSVERELADDLGVTLGSRLSWDVAGRQVESVVASIREVDWERFQTNFFVVFEPGPLDQAPATFVALARTGGGAELMGLQRQMLTQFPNVSVLDLGRVRETAEGLLGRVNQAITFLAGFSAIAGLLVLAGALAASRHQRVREGALLKTLGTPKRQLLKIFLSEYLALGTVAAAAGLMLAVGASWALIALVFGFAFELDVLALVSVWAGVVALTTVSGLLSSYGLLRRPPLQILREVTD
jgi:putative ABC transport system permease protein